MEGNGLLFIFHNIVNNLDNNLDNNSIATDDNFINQLNKITAEDKHESLTCSICLENFKKGEKIIQLPCNHFFHTDHESCEGIIPWLKKSNTCPECRHELPKKQPRMIRQNTDIIRDGFSEMELNEAIRRSLE